MAVLILVGAIIAVVIVAAIYKRAKPSLSPSNRVSSPLISSPPLSRHSNEGIKEITWIDVDEPGAEQFAWVDIRKNPSPTRNRETIRDDNFFNQNLPDDLDNILTNVIGSRDPYSQEKFALLRKGTLLSSLSVSIS